VSDEAAYDWQLHDGQARGAQKRWNGEAEKRSLTTSSSDGTLGPDTANEAQVLSSPPDHRPPRDRILAAATGLFAEHGFAGTNTRAIAKAADVKQVMVHYYYGSKGQLYDAVLKHEAMSMLAVVFGVSQDHLAPEEALVGAPIRLMTVLHDNPQWASLLRREIADGAQHLRAALREAGEHEPLEANLHFRDSYREAVRLGKVVDLPAEAVRECLLAIGYSAIYLAPLILMISERNFQDDTVWDEWKITLSTILQRGLLVHRP
jgi:AcrR family transcriptional regulator